MSRRALEVIAHPEVLENYTNGVEMAAVLIWDDVLKEVSFEENFVSVATIKNLAHILEFGFCGDMDLWSRFCSHIKRDATIRPRALDSKISLDWAISPYVLDSIVTRFVEQCTFPNVPYPEILFLHRIANGGDAVTPLKIPEKMFIHMRRAFELSKGDLQMIFFVFSANPHNNFSDVLSNFPRLLPKVSQDISRYAKDFENNKKENFHEEIKKAAKSAEEKRDDFPSILKPSGMMESIKLEDVFPQNGGLSLPKRLEQSMKIIKPERK